MNLMLSRSTESKKVGRASDYIGDPGVGISPEIREVYRLHCVLVRPKVFYVACDSHHLYPGWFLRTQVKSESFAQRVVVGPYSMCQRLTYQPDFRGHDLVALRK